MTGTSTCMTQWADIDSLPKRSGAAVRTPALQRGGQVTAVICGGRVRAVCHFLTRLPRSRGEVRRSRGRSVYPRGPLRSAGSAACRGCGRSGMCHAGPDRRQWTTPLELPILHLSSGRRRRLTGLLPRVDYRPSEPSTTPVLSPCRDAVTPTATTVTASLAARAA